MVLPVQSSPGVQGSLDQELAHALRGRAGRIDWVFPDEIRAALRRSPAVRAGIDALPVGVFLQREVHRIGDPLYGELRRAAAVVDANVALLPVQVRFRTETEERPAAVEIVSALVDIRTGRIAWFAILEGDPGAGDDPAAVASAMESLALALTGG